jgi:hypothetical protein
MRFFRIVLIHWPPLINFIRIPSQYNIYIYISQTERIKFNINREIRFMTAIPCTAPNTMCNVMLLPLIKKKIMILSTVQMKRCFHNLTVFCKGFFYFCIIFRWHLNGKLCLLKCMNESD